MKLTVILITVTFFAIFFSTFATYQSSPFLSSQQLRELSFRGYQNVNPNLLVYPIKKTIEDTKCKLTFNRAQQLECYYDLLDKRFSELVYIVNFKKTGFYNETIERYNTTTGIVKSCSGASLDSKREILSSYIKILEILRDKYPANSAYWMNVQQAIDTTRGLL